MKSMTGFGHGSSEVGGRRCIVEVRSFNHRFIDLKLRLPALWTDPLLEQLLGQTVRKRIHRGSVVVTIREEGSRHAVPQVQVNSGLAEAYKQAVGTLWQTLAPAAAGGPSDAVLAQTLPLLIAQPGILTLGEVGLDTESRYTALEPILEQALAGLLTSRQREGEALCKDLLERLGLLSKQLDEVAKLAEQAPEQQRRRLSDRLSRLLDTPLALDPQRLAQEVALLADRLDVTEEITRLRAHLVEFRRLCQGDALAGRQLDFLTQEIHREVNTIGSKAQSAEIAARIVAMKAELERLREQIQNVE